MNSKKSEQRRNEALKKNLIDTMAKKKTKNNSSLKILVGMLVVFILLFSVSIFDSNRISTLIMGSLVILTAIATIAKIYGYKL